ncbi:putative protein-S-isoprenylcysteine O-methyltransferase [Grifola frondosa]|uniref:Protein-S-isoprenylcysteine O-methyltransferase n=1 Tax=Grifola frondosa TaxID=5627 RepID=A0A1C7LXB2_GRIFR|nr:putative protein-S-isoprenylcysteine O-methyltransferase [Grifola frondosa]
MAGWISLVVGVLIRIACYRSLGRHFTFQLSVIDDHKLITGGPYSIVRHPGYTGFVLFTIGLLTCEYGSGSWIAECGLMSTWIGIVAFSWAIYFVYVTVLLVARVPTEDSILQKEFGVQWDEWAKRTPYRLVPGIV